ncbi:ATP-binding protein [Paenibacillus sp. PK3_47]|uniref:ATP-binding protein n=1 Tax=Paenibacillus sp. PK3_47 TaxID=2072642 RepID=UPI00201D783F|nr:ATP-binding protein [Paenibacillus sp. PK3_47]
MRNIVFLGGIHGVGKSFLTEEISTQLGIRSYSASKLISMLNEKGFTTNKYIDSIDTNQNQLIDSIKINTDDAESFLLDGHFCLLNTNGEVEKIPNTTFLAMCPRAIVVLFDSIDSIKKKLETRDAIKYEYDFLEKFQSAEIAYAKEISNLLEVPLLLFNSSTDDVSNLNVFLEKYL